jgi:hypothetical protein
MSGSSATSSRRNRLGWLEGCAARRVTLAIPLGRNGSPQGARRGGGGVAKGEGGAGGEGEDLVAGIERAGPGGGALPGRARRGTRRGSARDLYGHIGCWGESRGATAASDAGGRRGDAGHPPLAQQADRVKMGPTRGREMKRLSRGTGIVSSNGFVLEPGTTTWGWRRAQAGCRHRRTGGSGNDAGHQQLGTRSGGRRGGAAASCVLASSAVACGSAGSSLSSIIR